MRDSVGKLLGYTSVQAADVYLGAFLAANKLGADAAATSNLESIVHTLSCVKSFDARHGVYRSIQDKIRFAIKSQSYEHAAKLRDAITYYHRHILD